MDNKLIDVIIPAYNAHEKIFKTLCSIGNQSILPDIKVTIVNDCGEGYSKIVRKFKSFMDIHEITMEENGGPGVARQFGVDNTHCPYIYFIDADDVTGDRFCLNFMYKQMIENNYDMLIGSFLMEDINPETRESIITTRDSDTIWLHGKMYRRAAIDKYGIRFRDDLRQNEDVYWNAECISKFPNVGITDAVCYMWLWYQDSITKSNNYNVYGYDGWFKAMYYHLHNCQKLIGNPDYPKITQDYYNQIVAHCLVIGYLEYNSFIHLYNDEKILEDFISFVIPCFKDLYIPLAQEVNLGPILDADYKESVSVPHREFCVIPMLSLNEFIDLLHSKCE